MSPKDALVEYEELRGGHFSGFCMSQCSEHALFHKVGNSDKEEIQVNGRNPDAEVTQGLEAGGNQDDSDSYRDMTRVLL